MKHLLLAPMSLRAWKILSAIVVVLAFASPVWAQTQQEMLERTKETMRRLNLPPDPALEVPVAAAFARHKACLIEGMKKAFKSGKTKSGDLTTLACRACDTTLVAREKLFFRANSHRYMTPNLDDDIEKARKECPTWSVGLTWNIASLLDADPKENQAPPVSVSQFGNWNITGETNFSGELVYKATVTERSDPSVHLEAVCRPSSKSSFYGWLSYPPKLHKGKSFVTFSTDGNPPDQISVDIEENGFMATDLYFQAVSPVPSANKHLLLVNVQGIKLIFDVSGAPSANAALVERCHLQ